jgi:hypothetical protein
MIFIYNGKAENTFRTPGVLDLNVQRYRMKLKIV